MLEWRMKGILFLFILFVTMPAIPPYVTVASIALVITTSDNMNSVVFDDEKSDHVHHLDFRPLIYLLLLIVLLHLQILSSRLLTIKKVQLARVDNKAHTLPIAKVC